MKYIHGLGRLPLIEIDETGNTRINIFDDGGIIGVVEKNRVNYLLKDHLGSTRIVADEGGQKVGELNYSDFGETTVTGDVEDIRYRYTGQEWDEEVGEYNYLAREYDPATGRFNSPDPARQGFSPYVYVGNNSINFVDPGGKVKTLLTGSYIGYTESSSNMGKPTLYFTKGRLVQTHPVESNIGWHPIREGRKRKRVNITESESINFKEGTPEDSLKFIDQIKDGLYREKPSASRLFEVELEGGEAVDYHRSRGKLVRLGAQDFKSEYSQNYAEEMIKNFKIAENENIKETTLKYGISNEGSASPLTPKVTSDPFFTRVFGCCIGKNTRVRVQEV
ncbi:hypothetical protein PM10SUCC1_38870 [Propionigenium maris DSM 9537]|uniref:RHS repeat-associated core domain-containing protein n=1 Tax=Propionigenium maris DSM 9537 TaxID=1123000 RepID=A0A9W6GNM3_9FUSO|nr:RHS repeat-associated core domain-containing protein [Propionigenium maris]GLI58373.1 hypothetical protein PM10SUCC1_38870 [Propionigenium maris DSM 9537]